MHVIADRAQIIRRLLVDEERFVATGKEMPAQGMPPIKAHCVGAEEPLHSAHQVGPRGFDDEMKMVAHQAVGVHLPIGLGAGIRERGQEVIAIGRVEINVFPPIAPTKQMIKGPLVLEAELAWHGARVAAPAGQCQ